MGAHRRKEKRMGMSVLVVGVRDLTIKFDKMMAVKKACDVVNMSYPKELLDYFGEFADMLDDDEGLRSEMEEVDIDYEETRPEGMNIWQVDIAKLPKDVKKVRWQTKECENIWNNMSFDESMIVLCAFNASRVNINNIIRKK